MSAFSARVSGTLELTCSENGESATVIFSRGAITKMKTSAPVAYLGPVLYELGFIDSATLNESLRDLSRMKWLHGEILLTRSANAPVPLAEGLQEQTTRKLLHLFTFPATTTYTFEADADHLPNWGGADWPHVDPTGAVWRGVRDGFAEDGRRTRRSAATRCNAFRLATGVPIRNGSASPRR